LALQLIAGELFRWRSGGRAIFSPREYYASMKAPS